MLGRRPHSAQGLEKLCEISKAKLDSSFSVESIVLVIRILTARFGVAVGAVFRSATAGYSHIAGPPGFSLWNAGLGCLRVRFTWAGPIRRKPGRIGPTPQAPGISGYNGVRFAHEKPPSRDSNTPLTL